MRCNVDISLSSYTFVYAYNVCSGDVLIKRNNSYFPLFFNFVLFSRFVRFFKRFFGGLVINFFLITCCSSFVRMSVCLKIFSHFLFVLLNNYSTGSNFKTNLVQRIHLKMGFGIVKIKGKP